jgi:hypothetical protein
MSEKSQTVAKGIEMIERDKYDALGPVYAEIGKECVTIIGRKPDNLYLFGEAGEGYSGGGIFVDEGDSVRYYDPSSHLCDLLLQAWEAEGESQKWAIMEYEIKDSAFDAKLIYPDEIDQDLSISERRELYLQRRFGNKPVIYPPYPIGYKRL